MHLIFGDDSQQLKPSRAGVGPLVAIGGVHVPDVAAPRLEAEIERLCNDADFPSGEEFKWSPRPGMWMRDNLPREAFFNTVLTAACRYGATATVVVADARCRHAINTSTTFQHDVATMFLERVELALRTAGTTGVVVIDRPGGNRRTEKRFLAACAMTITTGTPFVLPQRITSVETVSSPHARAHPRLLQLADVVTGSTLARVAGEARYSPPVFAFVRPLLRTDGRRIGGVGLKLHPDLWYANLYYWLAGDTTWWKGNSGWGLPYRGLRYFKSPDVL